MKYLQFIVVIICILISTTFTQSNYEILLSRPDITGLTGGGAINLDGIPTTGLAIGTMVVVYDGSETRIYRLTAGTDAESSPIVIRPDDYAAGTNEKVWKARISSDPSETGFAGGGSSYKLDADNGSPTNVVYVDADGEVGIGTTSASTKLHTIGNVFIDNSASAHALGGNPGLVVDGAAGQDIVRFRDVGANVKVTVEADGDVNLANALYIGNVPDDAVHDSVLTIDGGQVKKAASSVFGARKIPGALLPTSSIPRGDAIAGDQGVPSSDIAASELSGGVPLFKLFHQVGLANSEGAARRLISQGGAYINGNRIEAIDYNVTLADVDDGTVVEVYATGYSWRGRLFRPARVKVARQSVL